MLRCFLYLAIAFKVGWAIFPDKGVKFSNVGILRLITGFEKESFSFIAASSSLIFRVLSSAFFQKIVPYLTRKAQQFSRNICFQLCAYYSNLKSNLFSLFVEVINTYFFVYKITVYFHRFCFSKSNFMIAFEITGLLKGLWFAHKCLFLRGACFSSTPVKIFEKSSKPFSLRNALFVNFML